MIIITTGKTSLVMALAGALGLEIYVVTLSRCGGCAVLCCTVVGGTPTGCTPRGGLAAAWLGDGSVSDSSIVLLMLSAYSPAHTFGVRAEAFW